MSNTEAPCSSYISLSLSLSQWQGRGLGTRVHVKQDLNKGQGRAAKEGS